MDTATFLVIADTPEGDTVSVPFPTDGRVQWRMLEAARRAIANVTGRTAANVEMTGPGTYAGWTYEGHLIADVHYLSGD